jgi:hypothetical protein
MATPFLQVSDNSKTLAPASSLANTSNPLTITGINTTKFPAVTTGFMVTIWDDVLYPDPGDDPNMEKAKVTAATINANGVITLTRTSPHAHLGTPRIALLVLAQHISELQAAVNDLQAVDIPLAYLIKTASGVVLKVTVDEDQSLVTSPYDDEADGPAFPFGVMGVGLFE